MSDKVEVENVNHPEHITRVDAVKYAAAKLALLPILSGQEQGLTQTEMMAVIGTDVGQPVGGGTCYAHRVNKPRCCGRFAGQGADCDWTTRRCGVLRTNWRHGRYQTGDQ